VAQSRSISRGVPGYHALLAKHGFPIDTTTSLGDGNKPRGALATRTHRKRVQEAMTPCNELIRGNGNQYPS